MRIQFSPRFGVVVEGTRSDLDLLHAAIEKLVLAGSGSATFEADTSGVAWRNYRFISRLLLLTAEGPTRVAVVNNELHIAGASHNLDRLASFVKVPDKPQAGWHSHYEYYDGNQWIAADSEPLQIGLSE